MFTNLTPEHLEFHGTMERYFEAKAGLLAGVKRAVINGDDPWLARLPGMFPETAFTVCTAEPGGPAEPLIGAANVTETVRAEKIARRRADGIEYLRLSEHSAFRIRTPMPGRFSVMNTLLAASAAQLCGADPADIREAAAVFRGAPGRMSRVLPRTETAGAGRRAKERARPAVFIDYAHTPEELEAVLGALREFSPGHLTVVFGCGGDRDRSKRPRMARAAMAGADEVIVTSDNPRTEDPERIFRDILEGIAGPVPWCLIPDRTRAVRRAILSSPPDGTVLLAGKGIEQYEIDAEGKYPFDEEDVASRALAEYGAGANEQA